jgi:uncharacterized membrane protein
MGENNFAAQPVALYGAVLSMAGLAYYLLTRTLLRLHDQDSALVVALGNDFKGKISLVLCAVAIPLAFISAGLACVLYVLVAVIWFVPDRRIEKALTR